MEIGAFKDERTLPFFYNARWYDASLGRFVQADTQVPQSQGVQAWDRYAYCNNNPLRYIDSTGHFIDPFSMFVGAMIVGAVVGGVVNAYQQYQSTGTIDAVQVAYSALGGAVLAGGVVIAGVGAATVAGGIAAAVTGGGAVTTAACADGDCTNEANAGVKAAIEVADDVVEAVGDPSDEMSTVGRWMSPAEYNKMMSTGTVQESYSGTTHVAYPANPAAYGAQAKPGSYYVEFAVPSSSLTPTKDGWASIAGPNSLLGRFAARKGLPIPQMPSAYDIRLVDKK